MHIHTLTCAGYIYMHICAYTMSQTESPARGSIIHACMFKYMHIYTYTMIIVHACTVHVHICSYMLIMMKYSYLYLHIHAYTVSRNWADP